MSPTLAQVPAPGFGRSVAVVIGVNAYANGLPPLRNAVPDATALGDLLATQGFEVLRLLDADARLSALEDLVHRHLPSLEPAPDRLFIYFAGHGEAVTDAQHRLSGFLLPSDARRDDPGSWWSMEALRQALRRRPPRCRHLLLILDCCFAGAFPVSRDLRAEREPRPLVVELFEHLTSRPSSQALLSTAHDEVSLDGPGSRWGHESAIPGAHSPLATLLLEALQRDSPADRNRDGLLTATELYAYLREQLVERFPRLAQSPALWNQEGHEHGEFLFLLRGEVPHLPHATPLDRSLNPYRGLGPYSGEHKDLFFGRERHCEDLLGRLRREPLVVLRGPSGSGKSSLVEAGLLPRLSGHEEGARWWLPPVLRPGATPLRALSGWLGGLGPGAPTEQELADSPERAAAHLATRLGERHCLLVVDSLEELVTTCLDEAEPRDFLRALGALLGSPRNHLLLMLRSDFEPKLLSLLEAAPTLRARWKEDEARFSLTAMSRDELRRCIVKPAEHRVLFFEEEVVKRLLDDVEQMPGALPLLSVALSELFDIYLARVESTPVPEERDRTFRLRDYQCLDGGVPGAIQRLATQIFHGAELSRPGGQPSLPAVPEEERTAYQWTLREVLLRMVSVEGGEPTRRRAPVTELEYEDPEENRRAQRALAHLVSARLVVLQSSDGVPTCEPAHDTLFTSWQELHDWVLRARSEVPTLRAVSRGAAEWERNGRSERHLWADERLDPLWRSPRQSRREDTMLYVPPLSPDREHRMERLALNALESAFLQASAAHRRFLDRRRNTLTAGAIVGLTTLAISSYVQAQKALRNEEEARLKARQALASARLVQAERLLEQDPTKAALVLLESFGDAPPAPWSAEHQAAITLSQEALSRAILPGAGLPVSKAEFQPDGAAVRVTTLDGTTRLWRTDGGGFQLVEGTARAGALQEVEGPVRPVSAAAPSQARRDRRRAGPAPVPAAPDPVLHTVPSPDGSLRLTAFRDGAVLLQRADGTGAALPLRGHAGAVTDASFSRDGSLLLTASHDGTVRVWRTAGAGMPPVLGDAMRDVRAVSFSQDGASVLATAATGHTFRWPVDGSGTARLVEGAEGHGSPPAPALPRDGASLDGPDGAYRLTLSEEGEARLWHRDGRSVPLVHPGGARPIVHATFSPDGAFVLTGADDGRVCLWRTQLAPCCVPLEGHTRALRGASFSADGQRVLTYAGDGDARVWRTLGRGASLVLRHAGLSKALLAPDGARAVTLSSEGELRLWPVEPGTVLAQLRDASRACLTAEERERYLLEEADEARARHASCARAPGEAP